MSPLESWTTQPVYHLEQDWIERIVTTLNQHEVCSKELLIKLINTPRMKEFMGERYPKLLAVAHGTLKGKARIKSGFGRR
jgi:hypothetical protein